MYYNECELYKHTYYRLYENLQQRTSSPENRKILYLNFNYVHI